MITCRTEETPPTGWLDRAQRNTRVDRLDLRPLTRAETAEQIELLVGEPPTASFVEATYARSEGNAFFTEQLVSSGQANTPLPAGLASLLLSRTTEITGAAREVLEALAVAARPLDEPSLTQICARSGFEVRAALRDLLSRRLLRAVDAAGRHQIRHALLAEAVSSVMLPDDRRDLHLKVADSLSSRNERALAAQIAAHLAAASRPDKELRWRVIAAEEAETVFASKEAAGQWQRVIMLWDHVADAEVVAGTNLVRVYLRAANATENSGHREAAAALAEEALTRLGATADPETAVSLYCTVGRYRGIDSVEAGLAALDTAIQIGEHLPPSVDYVRALSHYVHLLDAQGRHAEERVAVGKGLDAARAIDDVTEEKFLLIDRAWLAMTAGDRSDARDALDRAAQIVTEDPVADVTAAVMQSDLLIKSGDLHGAVDLGMLALTRSDIDGQADWFGTHMLRWNVCEALIELGDIDRAASIIDPITSGEQNWDAATAYLARALVDMRRGRLGEAKRNWDNIADLLAAHFDKAERHAILAHRLELSLWLGDPDTLLTEALAMLTDLVDSDLVGWRATCSSWRHGRAPILLTLPGPGATPPGCTPSKRTAPGWPACTPPRRSTRSRRARSRSAERQTACPGTLSGRGYAKSPTLSRGSSAASAWDALSRPHRAAYARWREAEALLAKPYGRAPATEVVRRAVLQATQHVPLSDALRDLAHRARIDLTEPLRPQPVEQSEPARTFGLTDREHAVLRLVSQGRTNAQIGATLFISTKTASVHVSNILRKLDVATRVQAATVAARAGLLSADEPDQRLI